MRTFLTRHFLKKVAFDAGISTRPVSKVFGVDRGTPIDRIFIEDFLSHCDIRGKCLEVEEPTYTVKFGRDVESKILKFNSDSPSPSVVLGDLTRPETVPQNEFDSFICTQTLNFIFEKERAVESIHRLLKPGGSAYLTVGGISQISRYDYDRWGDFWRFTDLSLKRLLAKNFDADKIQTQCYGNVASACLFLQGISYEEIPDKTILKSHDPDYQMVVCAKVTK